MEHYNQSTEARFKDHKIVVAGSIPAMRHVFFVTTLCPHAIELLCTCTKMRHRSGKPLPCYMKHGNQSTEVRFKDHNIVVAGSIPAK